MATVRQSRTIDAISYPQEPWPLSARSQGGKCLAQGSTDMYMIGDTVNEALYRARVSSVILLRSRLSDPWR